MLLQSTGGQELQEYWMGIGHTSLLFSLALNFPGHCILLHYHTCLLQKVNTQPFSEAAYHHTLQRYFKTQPSVSECNNEKARLPGMLCSCRMKTYIGKIPAVLPQ